MAILAHYIFTLRCYQLLAFVNILQFIFFICFTASAFATAGRLAIAIVVYSTAIVAFVAAIVGCVVAIETNPVVIVVKMIETAVKSQKLMREKHSLEFGLLRLDHDPSTDNRPNVGQGFSCAFPSYAYGYQNRACSCILLSITFGCHRLG